MSRSRLAEASGRHLPWAAAAVLACALSLLSWLPVQRFDLLAYDTLEPLFHGKARTQDSVVIAIDDAALDALGRWPWGRAVHARLIDRLSAAGVSAIGMSILFAEPSADDQRLAAAIAASGRVVLPVAPREAGDAGGGVADLLPTPELGAAAAALGHVDVELDADALVRRTYSRAGSGTPRWEALALATLRLSSPAGHAAALEQQAQAGAWIRRIASSPLWVREGELLLPYPVAETEPVRVSYHSLLERPELAEQLRGRTVFVGPTANGLDASLPTPDSRHSQPMAAVEFHARAYDALRSGLVYRGAGGSAALSLGLALLALAAVVHARIQSPSTAAAAVAGLALLPLAASGMALNAWQLWIPPSPALSSLLFGSLLWFGLHLQRTRGRLRHAQQDADATLRSIADAVFTIDEGTRVTLTNPVAERLTGLKRDEAQGSLIGSLVREHTEQTSQIVATVLACLKNRHTIRLPEPIEWQGPDGSSYALKLTATPVGDAGGGAVLAFNDVTDAIAATVRLQHEATHDLLTGLPNRALLLDRLRLALANAQRHNSMLALLFVDLDRFKRINDSLGHDAGDAVLRDVAARLQASVRVSDTIARWGGDEFIILMDKLEDRNAVIAVALKVLEILDREFEADGNTGLLLSCSIGISVGPDDSPNAETLLSMADKAMYRGKIEGGSRYTFYSPEMNTWSRDRLDMETALRHGLANQEFELFYQPQIEIASGRLTGLESLIRWQRPDKGRVMPDEFIPAAEESGIIRGIGEWAIHAAMRQTAHWNREGLLTVPLAVNVSARQFSDMTIVDTIREGLADSGLAPSMLKVELTESTAMRNPGYAAELLHSIHNLGVSIAVDDFGTGYSSLSLLKRFPVSELKIDRSFVGDVNDHDAAAIVRGTIALAHGLGMTVVAEGVETQAQLRFLADHGCDVAQGYLFAQPLPPDEIRNWLSGPPPHVLHAIDLLSSK
ncbi:EAL domain-containing protein [Thauera sp. SDU_THAU2]|uniref:EAL domain-containing protein n=1 Tax=Thauera sp. SDU_THAU2 TaxID=3136633 RepID=UPI00311E9987